MLPLPFGRDERLLVRMKRRMIRPGTALPCAYASPEGKSLREGAKPREEF
jgi:hypothetical protein